MWNWVQRNGGTAGGPATSTAAASATPVDDMIVALPLHSALIHSAAPSPPLPSAAAGLSSGPSTITSATARTAVTSFSTTTTRALSSATLLPQPTHPSSSSFLEPSGSTAKGHDGSFLSRALPPWRSGGTELPHDGHTTALPSAPFAVHDVVVLLVTIMFPPANLGPPPGPWAADESGGTRQTPVETAGRTADAFSTSDAVPLASTVVIIPPGEPWDLIAAHVYAITRVLLAPDEVRAVYGHALWRAGAVGGRDDPCRTAGRQRLCDWAGHHLAGIRNVSEERRAEAQRRGGLPDDSGGEGASAAIVDPSGRAAGDFRRCTNAWWRWRTRATDASVFRGPWPHALFLKRPLVPTSRVTSIVSTVNHSTLPPPELASSTPFAPSQGAMAALGRIEATVIGANTVFREAVPPQTRMVVANADLGPYGTVVPHPTHLGLLRQRLTATGAPNLGALPATHRGGGGAGAASSSSSVARRTLNACTASSSTANVDAELVSSQLLLMAANCVMFNAAEGAFPGTARQFAEGALAVVKDHVSNTD